MIRKLAHEGNKLIFTTSFGFMNPTLKVAKQFPDVKFEHCTGYQRRRQRRDLQRPLLRGPRGAAAPSPGMMSKSGVAGYIGSFPIPEVVMGINAFTLAAQKVNPNVQDQGRLGQLAGTTRPRKPTPPRR